MPVDYGIGLFFLGMLVSGIVLYVIFKAIEITEKDNDDRTN
jgi:hypothetical protein